MQELMQKHYEQLARATITQLRRRGFEAEWFSTAEEAKAAALRLLPEGCTVAWGGSATIRDMGLTEAVHAGNWKVIDRDLAKTPEERAELHRQGLLSDWYLMSANAISAEGVLVNIDGTGNRVSATLFGHEKVYFVIGRNKLAPTYEAAVYRARNVAAPQRARQLGKKTPCAVKADRCYDCRSPERVCRALVTLWGPMLGMETEVLLVDEDLGL